LPPGFHENREELFLLKSNFFRKYKLPKQTWVPILINQSPGVMLLRKPMQEGARAPLYRSLLTGELVQLPRPYSRTIDSSCYGKSFIYVLESIDDWLTKNIPSSWQSFETIHCSDGLYQALLYSTYFKNFQQYSSKNKLSSFSKSLQGCTLV
jgi:hypothetical protein